MVTGGHSPQVFAHLIKSFLRRLPPPGLLGAIPSTTLAQCVTLGTPAACAALLDEVPEPERSLLEWLIRVLLEVHEEREANKMRLKMLTVAIAPNLSQPKPTERAASQLTSHPEPLEELRQVERLERVLHLLCSFAIRIRLLHCQ